MGTTKTITMYYCILHYKGYEIIVENYIYKLAINRAVSFLTMDDVKKEIDRIENLKQN